MIIRSLILLCMLAVAGAFLTSTASEADPSYSVAKKIPLGGDGFWDYLTIDSASRRLYIGRWNRVMVIDTDTEKVLGEISGMFGVHGVAVAPEFNLGFITSGKDGTIRIFDLKTLKETAQVKAGSNPDAILYDQESKTIFAFNHNGKTATAIDARTGKKKGVVELGGEPEFAVADSRGKVYVNLEDKSEIAVIDTKKLLVTARWPLAPGVEPTGMAIDIEHRRLFSGCHNKLMEVLNTDTGRVVASLPIGAGVDAAGFDPESQNAFSSNGDGTLTVIHEKSPHSFSVVQNVQTQEGARTMALDAKTHRIWLCTATLEKAPNDTVPQNRHHKAIVPGSFCALVVAK